MPQFQARKGGEKRDEIAWKHLGGLNDTPAIERRESEIVIDTHCCTSRLGHVHRYQYAVPLKDGGLSVSCALYSHIDVLSAHPVVSELITLERSSLLHLAFVSLFLLVSRMGERDVRDIEYAVRLQI